MSRHRKAMPVALNLWTLRCARRRESQVRPTALATLQLNDPGRTDAVWAIVMNDTPPTDAPAGKPG